MAPAMPLSFTSGGKKIALRSPIHWKGKKVQFKAESVY